MSREQLQLGVLVIGRKRPGFDPAWGGQVEAAAYDALARGGMTLVKADAPAVDDATLRTAMEQLRTRGARALVVIQPTMGDGRLAPIVAQLWGGPVVLWGTPERPEAEKVTACSLVGAHAWGATLRQLGRPFELVYGDPLKPETIEAVRTAALLTAAATHLRGCKVGLVGYHAPGFIDMHADPFAIRRQLGVEMHHFSVDELCAMADAADEAAVKADVAAALAMKLPRDGDIADGDFAPNSRFYVAMTTLMAEQHLDALAVRCWPEIPNRYGHWPYLAMSRMTAAGQVVALEGDVDGALLGLMGKLAGLGVGYISDWLEHDAETITLWHPGHAPLNILEPGTARISRHFNDNKPLVIDAELNPNDPITLARLWRCDDEYRLTAVDARTIPPRKHYHGCSGLAALDVDVNDWFDMLVHEGMPHHVTVFPGQKADVLRRLGRMMGVKWIGG